MLVAIAIPVFTSQLHKSQDATDVANIRSYYAELQAKFLTDGKDKVTVETGKTITLSGTSITLNNVEITADSSVDDNGVHIIYKCSSDDDTKGSFGAGASSN